MGNTPELKLIEQFKQILDKNGYIDYSQCNNFGRNNKILGDIEFVTIDGEYLVIEAKSHHSKDAHNSYHKLFGELLKETGKNTAIRERFGNKQALAILLPADSCNLKGVTKQCGVSFYRRQFNNIPLGKFAAFGELVKSKYVFICSEEDEYIKQYTWLGFYNGEDHIRMWT